MFDQVNTLFNWAVYDLESQAYNKLNDNSVHVRNKYISYYQESIGTSTIDTQKRATEYLDARTASLPSGAYPETPDIANMKTSLSVLDDAIKQIGYKFHPADLRTYLKAEQTKAIEQIKAQQASDKKQAETNLSVVGVTPETRAKALNDLAAAQTKSLETFEKGMTEDITALDRASAKELSRIAILGTLRSGSKSTSRLIEEIHLRGGDDERVSVSMGTDGAALSNVLIDDLIQLSNEHERGPKTISQRLGFSTPASRIETALGTPIKAEKTADGGYTFSIEMPGKSWLPGYHHSPNDNPSLEFKVLAELLRATGSEKAVVNVNCANDKMAMNLARKAFAECRKAGFEEKNITVKINGRVFKAGDVNDKEAGLFKGHEQRKASTETRAAIANKTRDQTQDQAGFKKEMDSVRAEGQAAAAAAAAAAVVPPTGAPGLSS